MTEFNNFRDFDPTLLISRISLLTEANCDETHCKPYLAKLYLACNSNTYAELQETSSFNTFKNR